MKGRKAAVRIPVGKRSPQVARRRGRLAKICQALPEVDVAAEGRKNEHLTFRIRKKIMAYYLYDHHGDGRIALWCKAAPGEQESLLAKDPRRFFVPPYVGPGGWVGMRLDLATVDWGLVAYLVGMAYRLTAPRRLVARLERSDRCSETGSP
jgi:phosphoribosylglycinamide formyltransferase-1